MRLLLQLILVFTLVLANQAALAETIYLKNGKKINGEIVSRKDRYLRVKSDSGYMVHFYGEIEHIEKDGQRVPFRGTEQKSKEKDSSYKMFRTEEELMREGEKSFDKGRHLESAEYYEKAVDLNPNNPRAYYEMSNSYRQLGDYRTEKYYLEKALPLATDTYLKNEIQKRLNQLRR